MDAYNTVQVISYVTFIRNTVTGQYECAIADNDNLNTLMIYSTFTSQEMLLNHILSLENIHCNICFSMQVKDWTQVGVIPTGWDQHDMKIMILSRYNRPTQPVFETSLRHRLGKEITTFQQNTNDWLMLMKQKLITLTRTH
jgi:hypothetical protein